MSVKITLPSYLAAFTGDKETVEAKGNTIQQCLNDLVSRFPEIKDKLFAKNGELHGYVSVFVNDEDAYPGELSRPVADGDEIAIMYILGGG